MSEVKAAKDALVASLFELSRSASDAANATANLYKVSHVDDATPIESLNNLSKAINTLVSSIESPAAEPVKRAERKKTERDPNAPKKPLTMYFAYSFFIREQIRDERKAQGLPPLSAIEMNAHVKERWSRLSPAEKSIWQKKYQAELVVYNRQKEAYKAKLAGTALPEEEVEVAAIKGDSENESAGDSDDSDDSDDSEIEVPEPEKKKKDKKRKHDKEKVDKKKKTKKPVV